MRTATIVAAVCLACFAVGCTTHMVIGWRLGRPSALRPGTLRPADPLVP